MNMDPQAQLLEDYAALRRELNGNGRLLPALEHGGFSHTSSTLQAPDEVDAAIKHFAPVYGWLTRASASAWLQAADDWRDGHGQPISDPATAGPVLAGELVSASGQNLLLRHESGRWQLTTITNEPGASTHITDEYVLQGRRGAPGRLRYRRYYSLTAGGPQAVLAILLAGSGD